MSQGNTTVTFTSPVAGPDAPAAPAATAPAATTPAAPAARPGWLPEKFKDAEQMAMAYGELEKRMGAGDKTPVEPEKPEVDPAKPEGDKKVDAETVKYVETARVGLEKAGLSFDKYSQEYVTNGGKMSEESYAELAKAGFSKDMVDKFVEGQAALAVNRENELKSILSDSGDPAEGAEVFAKLRTWASENLTAKQKAAYNEAVARGDDLAALALRGLHAQYLAANPAEPNLIQGRSVAAGAGDSYASSAEMTADMKDPRYAKDSAFRAKVEAKVKRSTFR